MNQGPKLGAFLETVLTEKHRHLRAWGENNGLDRIFGERVDLKVVERMLEHFGVPDVLPLHHLEGLMETIRGLDDFVLFYQGAIELSSPHRVLPIPNAVLIGHPDAEVMWSCADDDHGSDAVLGNIRSFDNGGDCVIDSGWNVAPILLFGLNHARTEEFCHKLLAAGGLVPWRHGEKLAIDEDHDGLYWIRWRTDTDWYLEDA